jgi:microcystin-dependent protein
MHRIDNSSAVINQPVPGPPGTPGFFTNGNPATAQEATIVDDWWFNAIQEEILTVIEQAGIDPDKASTSQLFEALNRLYLGHEDLGDIYLTIATYRAWQAPILTANTSSAYTITYNIAPGQLADGMVHLVEFHVANDALATLNTNALGAKPLLYYSVGAWRQIPPRLLGPNQIHRVAYHAASDAYRLSEWRDTTGDYVATARAQARIGTIFALGQAVNRVQFAGLFAAFGTTHGQGNGSTTFNLPDLRGRTVAGVDGGAGRLGAVVAGTLGSFGGQEQMQYSVTGGAESAPISGSAYVAGTAWVNGIPAHVWGYTGGYSGGYVGVSAFGDVRAAQEYHNHTIDIYGQVEGNATVDATGWITGWTGGAAVSGQTDLRSNMQPTMVANYAICL